MIGVCIIGDAASEASERPCGTREAIGQPPKSDMSLRTTESESAQKSARAAVGSMMSVAVLAELLVATISTGQLSDTTMSVLTASSR